MKITRIQACRQALSGEPARRHQHKAANCTPPIFPNLESRLICPGISNSLAVGGLAVFA